MACLVPEIVPIDWDEALDGVKARMGLKSGARVVAAMSGGVDSSVVAGLLKRAGYEVIGITLQLYDHGQAIKKAGACCAGQDIDDARKAAQTLGIAHYVLDYESRFRQSVIEEFADSYLRGETPVPCIRCNQTVKFADLLAMSHELGAEAMATGHYVERGIGQTGGLNRPQLRKAVDPDRDQSYFLFATTPKQLDYLRFPLAHLKKPQVRHLAREMGLSLAQKPDSQDICFVPEGRYTTVIDRIRPNARKPGPIIHVDGRILGTHDGIIGYTIGQRRGLTVAVGEPLFVVRLDPVNHAVIVGPRDKLLVKTMRLVETNWLGDEACLDEAAHTGKKILARVRSTRPPLPAQIGYDKDGFLIHFEQGEDGVSAGQACVFYDEADPERVLGGGFMKNCEPA
jgi:tRNA-uridine 2-sulfurtransferase